MTAFSLLALLPAALLWSAHVGATTFPATVEVDLIFPRNETYAPSALFPIVFAFQNAALAPSLDPGFDITLWDLSGRTNKTRDPSLDLKWTNFTGSDPTYVYTYVTNMNATDAGGPVPYLLSWAFGAGNCSKPAGALTFGGGFRDNNVEFTIQNGGKQPDLADAAASSSLCSNSSHFAFNLTGTLDVSLPAQYDGRNTCAVFSDVQPLVPGNPCAVQVGSATASSISAALTATNCAAVSPVVSCPSKKNAAPERWNTLYTGYTALSAGLVAAFVSM